MFPGEGALLVVCVRWNLGNFLLIEFMKRILVVYGSVWKVNF